MACRAYLVIRNGSAQHCDTLKLDLVMIERAAPLPAVRDDLLALRFVFNVPVSFGLR